MLDIKLDIKEKYVTELEGLRSEIAKEKSVIKTLKSYSAPVPALDQTSPATVSGEAEEMEPTLPPLVPVPRRDIRHRTDYYQPHHPPMMHYTGHHTRQVNQPVNFSRAMEQDIQEKTRMARTGNPPHQQALLWQQQQEQSQLQQYQANHFSYPAQYQAPAGQVPLQLRNYNLQGSNQMSYPGHFQPVSLIQI